VNVLKAIHWTVRSWNETKTSTIESCFRDAGFPVDALLSSEVKDTDDDIPLNELVQRLFSVSGLECMDNAQVQWL
jgi:hypothetical protein